MPRPSKSRATDLMADPSLLLTEAGLTWVQDPAVRRRIVIPATFARWLTGETELDPTFLAAPADIQAVPDRRGQIAEYLGDFRVFPYRAARLTVDSHVAVLRTLLGGEIPLGELRADEWAYLQSNSVLGSFTRAALDAFRDAGSVILEMGREAGWFLVEEVIPKEHLAEYTTRQAVATGAIKWVVIGGAHAGGGTVGGVVGTAVGGPIGAWIGGLAGSLGAGTRTKASLLAIDP